MLLLLPEAVGALGLVEDVGRELSALRHVVALSVCRTSARSRLAALFRRVAPQETHREHDKRDNLRATGSDTFRPSPCR